MIKIIKIGDTIKQNIDAFWEDDIGVKHYNIPEDINTLRTCAIDTFSYQIGADIKKAVGSQTNLSANNSKAIVLLAKIISAQNPDISRLTDREKESFEKLSTLANTGYADSVLLSNTLTLILEKIEQYSKKIEAAANADSVDELIKLLST